VKSPAGCVSVTNVATARWTDRAPATKPWHCTVVKLTTVFARTHFGGDVVEEALAAFESVVPEKDLPIKMTTLQVSEGTDTWELDTFDKLPGSTEDRTSHRTYGYMTVSHLGV
jgi:hypothetical protein